MASSAGELPLRAECHLPVFVLGWQVFVGQVKPSEFTIFARLRYTTWASSTRAREERRLSTLTREVIPRDTQIFEQHAVVMNLGC